MKTDGSTNNTSKTTINRISRYPEDYLVTINIMDRHPAGIAIDYINEDTFCDFFYKDDMGHHHKAMVHFLQAFKKSMEDKGLVFDRKLRQNIICYLVHLGLTTRAKKCSAETKRAIQQILTTQWEQEESARYGFPETVLLPGGHEAKLTFDFNLICVWLRKAPEQCLLKALQQFSIAKIKARTQFDDEGIDQFCPYLQRPNQYLENKGVSAQPYPHPEVHAIFEARYPILYAELSKVKSYAKLLKAYQKFYKEWDLALRQQDLSV